MRIFEVENLFNPFFIGEVLRRLINSYNDVSDKNFPIELSYVAIPVLLHSKSVNLLPPTKRSFLNDWLLENPTVKIGYSRRAKSLIKPINKSLFLLSVINEIELNENKEITLLKYNRTSIPREKNEIEFIFHKSEVLGSMFGKAGEVTSIFYLFGIKP